MAKPRKKPENDILKMIRDRQNPDKLRKFLNEDLDKDYRESELYKFGFEDGQDMGKDLADQKARQELVALRTILDAMVESK